MIESVLLALTLTATTQSAVTPDSAEAILERASRTYERTTTLKADFVQRIEIRAMEREEEGRGVVYQKKPNYFLMRFEEPKGDVVVADGEWFWMYYPSAQPHQVIRTAIERSTEGATTMGSRFLVNPSERYVATYVGSDTVVGQVTDLISLVPKFDAPYTLVRVWIARSDHLVRKFEIHERNGTVRTMTLRNLEADARLPDGLFEFSPPAGVEVYTR
jgi:outer membrane lipoprotein carrier protein